MRSMGTQACSWRKHGQKWILSQHGREIGSVVEAAAGAQLTFSRFLLPANKPRTSSPVSYFWSSHHDPRLVFFLDGVDFETQFCSVVVVEHGHIILCLVRSDSWVYFIRRARIAPNTIHWDYIHQPQLSPHTLYMNLHTSRYILRQINSVDFFYILPRAEEFMLSRATAHISTSHTNSTAAPSTRSTTNKSTLSSSGFYFI